MIVVVFCISAETSLRKTIIIVWLNADCVVAVTGYY